MTAPRTFDQWRALPAPCAHFFAQARHDPLGALLASADPATFPRVSPAPGEPAPPLQGLPIGIKDNLCTADLPTTAGSRHLEGFQPPFDATCVARLRRAGACIVAKTNLDEFAMGDTGRLSAFKPTRHPHSADHSPGGSSSGSAAAVAAGWLPAALGSDTGGSLRLPASFCGIVGFKPTYGMLSRHGLIALASSLDHVGLLTHSVADAALLFELLAGLDPLDPTSLPPGPPAPAPAGPALRLGIPTEFIAHATLHPSIARAFEQLLDRLRQAGHTLVDVASPHLELATPAYIALATAEAASNMARFDGLRFGRRAPITAADTPASFDDLARQTRTLLLGPEVRRRILTGTYLLAGDAPHLRRARQARALIHTELTAALTRVDALLTPTSPELPPRQDAPLTHDHRRDRFTIPANLAGLPALSLPLGHTEQRLSFGLQLIGAHRGDRHLLAIARTLEDLIDARPLPASPASPAPGR
ncbi:Asp-tRNA(Asn)/Glu-tRNA(Gln) amidotransferase subunit GatA [Lujinxingia litoralis]|uniref:Glutamyl-tRNA(Gln) amidotransferase subunit A n=1 Tax=Lujinxingia litoralis TaxID=2211119 RepID=A0A328C9G8_9DELT|nr:amidase family protein [Lujinxingia litoralis]RAL23976.1 Asp-tRNA(Asn)/Glu-tRNA(Gln) amidotransferase subunit GatA [Lujinxingia litoralis]